MQIKIEDIMDTWNCSRDQAEKMDAWIREIVKEELEKDREVPF